MARGHVVASATWRGWLLRTRSGGLRSIPFNAAIILAQDEALSGVVDRQDERGRIILARRPPWRSGSGPMTWTELDNVHLATWLAEYHDMHVSLGTVAEGVVLAARRSMMAFVPGAGG